MTEELAENLADMRCEPCTSKGQPMTNEAANGYLQRLGKDWRIIEERKLFKRYVFPDFRHALAFVNQVGILADQVRHHPDCLVAWGRAEITLWTHDINGLHLADFILAAKIDRIQPS